MCVAFSSMVDDPAINGFVQLDIVSLVAASILDRAFRLDRLLRLRLNIVSWYRPPCYNEFLSINDLFPECEKIGGGSMGTIIIGD